MIVIFNAFLKGIGYIRKLKRGVAKRAGNEHNITRMEYPLLYFISGFRFRPSCLLVKRSRDAHPAGHKEEKKGKNRELRS